MAVPFAAMFSCSKEQPAAPVAGPAPAVFHLCPEEYAGTSGPGQHLDVKSSAGQYAAGYDRVEFAVTDMDGNVVRNLKGVYDRNTSSINIEGLQAGSYRLLVLGIQGDSADDGAVIHDISHASEQWLSFPENPDRSLSAEYFHSTTPFTVKNVSYEDGNGLVTDVSGDIVQKRIVGRIDIRHVFSGPYIESAVVSNGIILEAPRFYTGLSGDGVFSGKSRTDRLTLDLTAGSSFIFMPTVEDGAIGGENEVITRDYRGGMSRRVFVFSGVSVSPNAVSEVNIDAVHPDDGSGTMFITEKYYESGSYGLILQDDEPHEIYTDFSKRNFNTASPLQVSLAGDSLHVRFYSPKDLKDVLIRAMFPGTEGEYVDLAYFDRIPAFADFYETLPVTSDKCIFRTESGRLLEIPATDASGLAGITFRLESKDPYWEKLKAIRHGWNIRFSLYGGDPEREDGGPAGNWMGIRPVHCREAVAFFLNFTYMIDMPEHELILMENQDRLYGNGGPEDKVTPETVLAQMRQTRTINAGLVYTGNGVLGLGGGNVFGAYQGAWFNHYTSTYACEIMFHELGHVMGYSHSSAFTYGPWAQELMNKFYVDHIQEMPVDSPSYLDSRNNPHIYASQPKSPDTALFRM